MSHHHPLINIATKAAVNASKIILRNLERVDQLEITRKNINDFATIVDKLSEQEIINTIQQAYPNHAILSEETETLIGNDEYTWIIDPLDGATNYIHGYPHFSIAISIKYQDKIQHGLVYDPLRDELFTATRGAGAFLNNRRMRVSKQNNISESLLGLAYSDSDPKRGIDLLSTLSSQVTSIRRSGSTSLDIAYVAASRLDGFSGTGSIWDIAPGSLLVLEAGGFVSDFAGKDNYLATGEIVAANQKISQQLLSLIKTS